MINSISEKNGYYPAKIIPQKFNKKVFITMIQGHIDTMKKTESDVQILWHLSALNKLITDYKTFTKRN